MSIIKGTITPVILVRAVKDQFERDVNAGTIGHV